MISVSYKCTKGSMKISDFSFKNCMYVEETKPIVVTENKVDIPDTPLMSDVSFGVITGDEEEDYSNVIDYFELSRIAVRTDDQDDHKDVYAATPGECAKICYDMDEDIGELDYECNAFQTDGRRKCRIFWSTSHFADKRRTEDDQLAFRLKQPRDRESHEKQKEIKTRLTGQVHVNSEENYNGTEKALEYGNHDSGSLGISIKSVIIPDNYAVELFDGDLSGTSVVFYDSQRTVEGSYRSIKVLQIDGEGNLIEYEPEPEG